MTTEESTPERAQQIFRSVLSQYAEKLKTYPTFTCAAFCRQKHINYKRFKYWMESHGITVGELKRSTVNDDSDQLATDGQAQTFVQFVPSQTNGCTSSLKGVSITFPDGINLTLQECSIESIIGFLETYSRRRAVPCSD